MKYDVFISHSSKDFELANHICEYLEADNIKCWIAPRNITGGMAYARAIFQGIDESQVVLLLFSEHSNHSRHIETEIDHAFNKEKIIIPFRISDVPMSEVLSYYVSVAHYIDGRPVPENALEQLKENIISNLPKRRSERDVGEAYYVLAKELDLSIDEVKQLYENISKNKNNDRIKPSRNNGRGLSNKIGHNGIYSILQNAKGEIMIMMDAREGEPENPRFIYDGGDVALLYRGQGSTVAFRDIEEEARQPLKDVSEVLVVEIWEEEVEREFLVPVRTVSNVKKLIIDSDQYTTNNITKPKADLNIKEVLTSPTTIFPENVFSCFTDGLFSLIKGYYLDAITQLGKAAHKGDFVSRYILGLLYATGIGVNPDKNIAIQFFNSTKTKDYDFSIIGKEWLEKIDGIPNNASTDSDSKNIANGDSNNDIVDADAVHDKVIIKEENENDVEPEKNEGGFRKILSDFINQSSEEDTSFDACR